MPSASSGRGVRLVVDASVAVEYLLRTRLGERAAETLSGAALFAPELLDVEVLAVLRKAVLARRLTASRAALAVADLAAWNVARLPHAPLLSRAWRLRENFTAYDAFYVAAARECDASLVTADGPLARAPSSGVVIHNIRAG